MKTNRLVLLLGLAGFMVMADNWVVSPILPAIAGDLSVSAARAGILISAYMLPFGLFQLVYGPLADRFGKAKVIIGTLAAFSVATALAGLAGSISGLAIFRAITGVFAAATMPISLALIADEVEVTGRQKAIGSFMGIAFLGQALSMGIGGAIAYYLNWRGVFVAYGVVSAFITVVLWTRLRHAAAAPAPRTVGSPLKPYFSLLGERNSRRAYTVILLEGVFLLGSFSYLGARLQQSFDLTFLAIGAVMTAFGVGAVIGGRTSSRIAARLGAVRTLAAGLALAAIADGIVLLASGSLALTTVGVFALGLGFMTAHSTLLTIATEFAAKARGTAMSLVTFAFMVGGAAGTQIGGRLVEATSYSTLYAVYGAALALLALAALPMLGGAAAVLDRVGQRAGESAPEVA
ncbi:MAG: MFS transporter [Coriobacteriia bacterium]